MKEAKRVRPTAERSRIYQILVIISILALVALVGFSAYQSIVLDHSLPKGTTYISQAELESKYGLKISLVGITAAGGMIDVRLTIVDGEKAKTLLGDTKNYPFLFADQRYLLRASEDTPQSLNFKNGGRIFVLFPNSRGVVKPGTPVSLVFGTTAIEPMPAQ